MDKKTKELPIAAKPLPLSESWEQLDRRLNMTTGTVIHGTLRTRDLIEAFGRELLRINPKCNCEYVQALVDNPESGDEFDLENLFDTLNYIAPEGYYFGAHEGDGSDFGFWQCEE